MCNRLELFRMYYLNRRAADSGERGIGSATLEQLRFNPNGIFILLAVKQKKEKISAIYIVKKINKKLL